MCDFSGSNVTQGTVNGGSVCQDRGEGDLLSSNGGRLCSSGKDGRGYRSIFIGSMASMSLWLYMVCICVFQLFSARMNEIRYIQYLKESI